MNKPILILTVGLPKSGKSTWSQSTGWPVVSPNAIRHCIHGQDYIEEYEPIVWATASMMVRALFAAGNDIVILDACSVTAERRAEWQDPRWETCCMQFSADKDLCIERALQSGRADLVPVIERMAAKFEPLPEQDFANFETFLTGAKEAIASR